MYTIAFAAGVLGLQPSAEDICSEGDGRVRPPDGFVELMMRALNIAKTRRSGHRLQCERYGAGGTRVRIRSLERER